MEKVEEASIKTSFLEKLRWDINEEGDHYLVKKVEKTKEDADSEQVPEISAYYSEYDRQQEFQNNLYGGQWINSELGKYEISEKLEGTIKLKAEPEALELPLSEVNKDIKLQINLFAPKGKFDLGPILFDINDSYDTIINIIAGLTSLPNKYIKVYHNKTELSSEFHLYNLDPKAENKLEVVFKETQSTCLNRGSSKTYSWYEKKYVIGFKTPTSIKINAIGFYRYEGTNPVTYEFYCYEVDNDKNKTLKSSLTDIFVNDDNVDQSTYIRKVSVPPFEANPEFKYLFYIYFGGDSNTRTYYSYSCSDTITAEDGLVFKFSTESEEGHRSETYNGHVPHIYYEIITPYS